MEGGKDLELEVYLEIMQLKMFFKLRSSGCGKMVSALSVFLNLNDNTQLKKGLSCLGNLSEFNPLYMSHDHLTSQAHSLR